MTNRTEGNDVTETAHPDLQKLSDQLEVGMLAGKFCDAAMQKDYDAFADLFTEDGVWSIPDMGVEFRGAAEIRNGIERMLGLWEVFVQNVHPGMIELDGDTAEGRVYVSELGKKLDGTSQLNYSTYHDAFVRTSAGWKFSSRRYEFNYLDESPLAGG